MNTEILSRYINTKQLQEQLKMKQRFQKKGTPYIHIRKYTFKEAMLERFNLIKLILLE